MSACDMLVYATSETPAATAASMARRWLATRSSTVVVEISSSLSAPSKPAARLSGSAKSARRTTTPRSAKPLSMAMSLPVATMSAVGTPRVSSAWTVSPPS